jgi:hypothetical protein
VLSRLKAGQNVKVSLSSKKLGYDNYLFKEMEIQTTCDFREANVSIKSVYSISVLWSPRGEQPNRSAINSVLSRVQFNVF